MWVHSRNKTNKIRINKHIFSTISTIEFKSVKPVGGALHLGGPYIKTKPVEASFLGHIFFNLQVCCANVYFLFSDYSFVKFITTALTTYIDAKSQDKSERPLVNRSDFSVREDKLSAVI